MENLIGEPAVAYAHLYSMEEFLNLEWNDVRYEFWDGQLLPMAVASLVHNEIVFNIHSSIKKGLKNKTCKSYQENVFLKLMQFNKVLLPDVMVSCKPDEFIPKNNFLKTPTVLVEVLSESTELYDRTKKWEIYRRIPSLRYYLLVSQNEFHIDMYQRANEQSLYYFQAFDGKEAIISFKDIGFEISLNEIYEDIQFEEPQTDDSEAIKG
jgi:Uma2 family endonuclease